MGRTPGTDKNSGARNGRVIMHLDMDAFFVNVELLETPFCAVSPLSWHPGPRSVVCSASYEARAHGVSLRHATQPRPEPQPQRYRPAAARRLPALLPRRHGYPERSEPYTGASQRG